MSKDAALKFLKQLQTQFRTKKHEGEDHEARWLELMLGELSGYGPTVLDRAAKDIMRKRRNEYFPVLSECLAACDEAKHWLDMENPKLKLGGPAGSSGRISDRRKLADTLIMGEMGWAAANEGWVLSLHDHVIREGRMPDRHEAAGVKHSAAKFDLCMDALRGTISRESKAPKQPRKRGGGFKKIDTRGLNDALLELGCSMLAKRGRLADMVLHGVVP